jgi:hypothetical protein
MTAINFPGAPPSRTIDVSALFGAGAGFLELHAYDAPNGAGSRFTLATGGQEDSGIVIPKAAMASFQALVGGVSVVVTPTIDFTATGETAFTLPSMPAGWYAVPIAARLIATTVTATAGPTISVGNGTEISGLDNVALEQGGWQLAGDAPAWVTIGIIGGAKLLDLSTAPIKVDVLTGASGGSFSGFVVLLLELLQLE